MLAERKVLILSTIMQLIPFANADNLGPVNQSGSTVAEPFARHLSRPDIMHNHWLVIRENPSSAEATIRAETEPSHGNIAVSPDVGTTGLHRTADNQRPSLDYRISDQSTIHLHIGRHGGQAQASWSF